MHKKIFWIEDHPKIYTIESIEGLSNGKINAKTLIGNTTFAHDFVSAEKVLKSDDTFDLYITDGDFPMIMKDSQKKRVNDYLEKISNSNRYASLDGGFKDQYYNAFVEIVLDYLLDKNFIVHSMSQSANALSFLFGWPFYGKNTGEGNYGIPFGNRQFIFHNDATGKLNKEARKKSYNFISKSSRWSPSRQEGFFEMRREDSIDNWEHGGSLDLVQKHILPLFK
jgi:hypothetical protein